MAGIANCCAKFARYCSASLSAIALVLQDSAITLQFGITKRPWCSFWAMTSANLVKQNLAHRAYAVAQGRDRQPTHQVAPPCNSPKLTPANDGWKSAPWPSTTSQWSGLFSGVSHSTAPEIKSETTASTETPAPSIKIPVCPVARKVADMPRCFKCLMNSKRSIHFSYSAITTDG